MELLQLWRIALLFSPAVREPTDMHVRGEESEQKRCANASCNWGRRDTNITRNNTLLPLLLDSLHISLSLSPHTTMAFLTDGLSIGPGGLSRPSQHRRTSSRPLHKKRRSRSRSPSRLRSRSGSRRSGLASGAPFFADSGHHKDNASRASLFGLGNSSRSSFFGLGGCMSSSSPPPPDLSAHLLHSKPPVLLQALPSPRLPPARIPPA